MRHQHDVRRVVGHELVFEYRQPVLARFGERDVADVALIDRHHLVRLEDVEVRDASVDEAAELCSQIFELLLRAREGVALDVLRVKRAAVVARLIERPAAENETQDDEADRRGEKQPLELLVALLERQVLARQLRVSFSARTLASTPCAGTPGFAALRPGFFCSHDLSLCNPLVHLHQKWFERSGCRGA